MDDFRPHRHSRVSDCCLQVITSHLLWSFVLLPSFSSTLYYVEFWADVKLLYNRNDVTKRSSSLICFFSLGLSSRSRTELNFLNAEASVCLLVGDGLLIPLSALKLDDVLHWTLCMLHDDRPGSHSGRIEGSTDMRQARRCQSCCPGGRHDKCWGWWWSAAACLRSGSCASNGRIDISDLSPHEMRRSPGSRIEWVGGTEGVVSRPDLVDSIQLEHVAHLHLVEPWKCDEVVGVHQQRATGNGGDDVVVWLTAKKGQRRGGGLDRWCNALSACCRRGGRSRWTVSCRCGRNESTSGNPRRQGLQARRPRLAFEHRKRQSQSWRGW